MGGCQPQNPKGKGGPPLKGSFTKYDIRVTLGGENLHHIRIDPIATNLYQVDEFGREIVYTPITILSDALLPGKGQRGKNCGKIAAIGVCPNCGNVVFIKSSCYQPLCPSCWHKWRMRRAKAILTKLEGFRRYKFATTGRNWKAVKFHHVVVSPPQNLEYALVVEAKTPEKKRILDKLFKDVKAILETVGAYYGGYIIFHPFRLKDEEEFGGDFEKEARKWREILKKDNWMDYVKFSPHFHCFVVASSIDGEVCRRVYEKTGWIVHRITKPNSNVSIGNLFDLARSLLYCMSHMGIFEEKYRTARFFGEIANFVTRKKEIERDVIVALLKAQNRLKDAPKVVLGKVPLICAKCGAELKLIYVKRVEEAELERLKSLRQSRAPPPRLTRQDKNGELLEWL